MQVKVGKHSANIYPHNTGGHIVNITKGSLKGKHIILKGTPGKDMLRDAINRLYKYV